MNKIYSVAQINAYIRNMFTQDFLLNDLTVRGEVSDYKAHPSGHIYFTLKDQNALLSVVMFAGNRVRGLKCAIKNGQKVVVRGQISVYEAAGKYQLYAKEIKDEGEGDLYREFLRLKEKLSEMGMFDASYKKPLPKYAMTVGVVTASSGAALRDVVQIAGRRNPYVQLILSPAAVQGEHAAESIVEAIARLDRVRPDVMIVGRGGGSQEDLSVFNDERVARAVFDCDTPVISAVGHEVDFTIIDFVADHRAPTPSAAAELAVFDIQDYLVTLRNAEKEMTSLLERRTERLKNRLDADLLRLRMNHPAALVRRETERLGILTDTLYRDIRAVAEDRTRRLEVLKERLSEDMRKNLRSRVDRLTILSERLNGRSPLMKLRDGFGYISGNGKPVRHIYETAPGDRIGIILSDGRIEAEVITAARFGDTENEAEIPTDSGS